jgi:hypothetical protein
MLTLDEEDELAAIFAEHDVMERMQDVFPSTNTHPFFTQSDYDNLDYDRQMEAKEAQLNTRGYAIV